MSARTPLLVVLALAAAVHAAAQDLPRGSIVDTVVCAGNPGQSYSLYLPSGYSPDRRFPILYALDPGARGRIPVERFQEAAEALGFIVVGSHNSRNGPRSVSEAAINAMLADTVKRFSLDLRRIYFTGFSGGARTAVLVGTAMAGQIAGVIGFGAGFPQGLTPSSSMPFAYFSAAGTDDFNYPELVALDRTLEALKVRHRYLVFEGGHEWPTAATCARALEWMELQAIRAGLRPSDEVLLGRIFSAATSDAAAEEQAGRPHLAAARYKAFARDFAGLRDVAAYEARARELERSAPAREAESALKDSIEVQEALSSQVHRLIVAALAGDDTLSGTRELLAEVDRVRKQAESGRRPADRMAARRVLTSTWIWLNEGVDADFEKAAFLRAATRLRVMAVVRPDNPRVEVWLARAYARGGNRKEALAALRRAVEKGFTDADALEKEDDLASLRADASFREIVAGLKGKS